MNQNQTVEVDFINTLVVNFCISDAFAAFITAEKEMGEFCRNVSINLLGYNKKCKNRNIMFNMWPE